MRRPGQARNSSRASRPGGCHCGVAAVAVAVWELAGGGGEQQRRFPSSWSVEAPRPQSRIATLRSSARHASRSRTASAGEGDQHGHSDRAVDRGVIMSAACFWYALRQIE
jgi:hypothetical protein